MRSNNQSKKNKSTSWEPVSKWYHQAVGEKGHYFHQNVIFPKLLDLLHLQADSSVIDLACGQGILARHLPESVNYLGIDIAQTLVREAKQLDKNPRHHYLIGDLAKPLAVNQRFSHAVMILAMQNMAKPQLVIKHISSVLEAGGLFVMVMNHPCFRIPRQSSWGVDQEKKIQYRRIDTYLSEQKIPIKAHPSEGNRSVETWSFHHPLSSYTKWLHEAGFSIEIIDEWCSDKKSEGKMAKMEDRSRNEIPLFLTIVARKNIQ